MKKELHRAEVIVEWGFWETLPVIFSNHFKSFSVIKVMRIFS